MPGALRDEPPQRVTAHDARQSSCPASGAPLRLAERPVPEPGPGEVRVRVEACGVCGSDVFLQKGGFGATRDLPGRSRATRPPASSMPSATASTASAVGDQVALYYITTPPGDPWAARGRPNISPHVTRMGVDVDGAFAEYVLRPAEALIRPARARPARRCWRC